MQVVILIIIVLLAKITLFKYVDEHETKQPTMVRAQHRQKSTLADAQAVAWENQVRIRDDDLVLLVQVVRCAVEARADRTQRVALLHLVVFRTARLQDGCAERRQSTQSQYREWNGLCPRRRTALLLRLCASGAAPARLGVLAAGLLLLHLPRRRSRRLGRRGSSCLCRDRRGRHARACARHASSRHARQVRARHARRPRRAATVAIPVRMQPRPEREYIRTTPEPCARTAASGRQPRPVHLAAPPWPAPHHTHIMIRGIRASPHRRVTPLEVGDGPSSQIPLQEEALCQMCQTCQICHICHIRLHTSDT